MTLTRNAPGRRYVRRLSALERLNIHINSMENLLAHPAENTTNEFQTNLSKQIVRAKQERDLLSLRTQSGGKKTTKKVGKNIGR